MRKREKGKNEWSRKEGRFMGVATSEYDKRQGLNDMIVREYNSISRIRAWTEPTIPFTWHTHASEVICTK